jgi:putative addiction module killer protein
VILSKEGPFLGMPMNRYLGQELYELRDLGKGPGYRIYYCVVDDRVVVLLTSGNKDSQERDIVTARNRMENLDE